MYYCRQKGMGIKSEVDDILENAVACWDCQQPAIRSIKNPSKKSKFALKQFLCLINDEILSRVRKALLVYELTATTNLTNPEFLAFKDSLEAQVLSVFILQNLKGVFFLIW